MRQLKIVKQITNRESASFDIYLHDIGRVELLTAEDEVSLAKKIRQGDKNALEKLVKANLRFVVSVAKQYQNQGLSLPDLVNEGNLGLIKAAKRFDETRGFKFISYAVWWIRQCIIEAIGEQSRVVRLPANKVGSINKMVKVVSKLEQKLVRDPSDEELAEVMGLHIEDVGMIRNNDRRHKSMDAPLHENDLYGNMHDVMCDESDETPDKFLIDEGLKFQIRSALSTLHEREAEVLKLFYGLEGGRSCTYEEIGEKFDLHKERVRQIKEKAIKRIRSNTKKVRLLRPYLG